MSAPAPVNPVKRAPTDPVEARRLSPGEAEQVRAAGARARKIRRAAAVAGFNGWTAAVFGVAALAGGFWSLPALVLGIGLGVAAALELHGRAMLLKFEPRAGVRLALNQALIAGAVAVYCLWQIWNITHAPRSQAEVDAISQLAGADPAMGDMVSSIADMSRSIMLGVYGLVIVLTAIFQGLMALYYLSRARLLAEHVRTTPAWITDIQRRLAA